MKLDVVAVKAIVSLVAVAAMSAVADSHLDPIPLPANNVPSSFAIRVPADGREWTIPLVMDWYAGSMGVEP